MSCIDTDTVRGHETIVSLTEEKNAEAMPWNRHPKFEGVFLRHLVAGKDTGGRISLHHVQIYPGCSIDDHAHPSQVEIHDVLDGEGVCLLEGREIRYVRGVMGIMPADKIHRIDAGERGMLLLATFCPPLV